MKGKKRLAMVLSGTLALVSLFGCSQKQQTKTDASPITLNGDEVYPVQCEDTLSYWMPLNALIAKEYSSFGETPIGQELEKRTGIKVEYIHPQGGSDNEQFNILLASNSLPDMTQYTWITYAGGPDKAIDEGYILSLNDYMKYMPALSKLISEDKEIDKSIKTDRGNYYSAPFVREEQWQCTYQGLSLRKDWLEETGLSVPKTIDELETVLRAFKEKYNCAPLAFTSNDIKYIMYAYNIAPNFYVDNGDVKYGYAQPELKTVLQKLKNWYDEGLIDNNFAVADSKKVNSRILNSQSGAFFGAVGGGMGEILSAKPESSPKFDLVAAPCLTVDGSAVAEFAENATKSLPAAGTSISTTCKNPELAARFLDYGYTEAGYLLNNFGIEGESYNMVDGEPVFSELLTNRPQGVSLSEIAVRYMRSPYNGSFVQSASYVEQSLVYTEQQMDAYTKWSDNNMTKHLLPAVTLAESELDRAADISASLKTYVDEMTAKFIVGSESLDNFDKFIDQLNQFGLEELTKMEQDAYDRYMSR